MKECCQPNLNMNAELEVPKEWRKLFLVIIFGSLYIERSTLQFLSILV